MNGDVWLTETYFDWLRSDCFSEASERREYEGVLRVLHDIPFYWSIWSDENRGGDAISFRQNDFLGFQTDLGTLDQKWLNSWAQAAPSILEVLLGVARRWSNYFEGPIPFYFGHMFLNMGFDRYPGRVLTSTSEEQVRLKCDEWLQHQLPPTGEGGPFPLKQGYFTLPMERVDILMQMNAYSLEHFQ